jgi:hypothetical protein
MSSLNSALFKDEEVVSHESVEKIFKKFVFLTMVLLKKTYLAAGR